jgi:hypothetical protein
LKGGSEAVIEVRLEALDRPDGGDVRYVGDGGFR